MKRVIQKITMTFVTVSMLICVFVPRGFAAGLLKPVNRGQNDVQMKSHRVDVTINNGFARTQVEQVFMNTGKQDLEAIYSFPLPKQASLSELSLWIDGQEVIGEVLKKEKAKEIYEQQKAKGNDTALAEKNDYKTFDVRVYPVRAEDETTIRLVYYQPLEIDLNVGRYVYPLEEGGVDEERISFWSVDDKVSESLVFNLTLKSAFPVKDLRVPNYTNQAEINKQGTEGENDIYTVNLAFHEGASLSKDIICYYRLEDTVSARVELVPYRKDPNEEGTFMVVVTPGASLQKIREGTDWTFVLDVSGSMDGDKIQSLVKGVSKVIGEMSYQDRFRIVTFNDTASEFTGGYITATPENVNSALEKIGNIRASGGTALYAGLSKAYNKLDSDRTTGIILVTDGVANIGPSKHSELVNLLEQNDYRLFILVMGNSANQPLLDALAQHSGGFALNISTSDDIVGRILQAKAKVFHECIYNAKLEFHGEKIKEMTPSTVRNLYMGQQLVLFGKYTHPGDVTMTFSGKVSGDSKEWTCRTTLPEIDTTNPEIERLWALSAIDETMAKIRLEGESASLCNRIIDLGTEYSLVTDYTSMVVIDDAEIEGLGIDRKNANRVYRERTAQASRAAQPARNYRVDNSHSSGGMFNGSHSHGIGSGPVGPFFLGLAYWIRRRRANRLHQAAS